MEHNTIFSTPAKVVMDRVSDKSKGFGFVTFASEDEAHTALTEMNGKVCSLHFPLSLLLLFYILEFKSNGYLLQPLNGRVIFVDYAKPTSNFRGGIPIARGPPEEKTDK